MPDSNTTKHSTARTTLEAFRALPVEAMPSIVLLDEGLDEFPAWEVVMTALRGEWHLGGRVQLHASRPGWEQVIVDLAQV